MSRATRRTLGDRPPSFMSRATLAAELDISESTIDEYVRRGILPKPARLSDGCVRWRWAAVQSSLASLESNADSAPVDPFMEGARNVTRKAAERRRGAA